MTAKSVTIKISIPELSATALAALAPADREPAADALASWIEEQLDGAFDDISFDVETTREALTCDKIEANYDFEGEGDDDRIGREIERATDAWWRLSSAERAKYGSPA